MKDGEAFPKAPEKKPDEEKADKVAQAYDYRSTHHHVGIVALV